MTLTLKGMKSSATRCQIYWILSSSALLKDPVLPSKSKAGVTILALLKLVFQEVPEVVCPLKSR